MTADKTNPTTQNNPPTDKKADFQKRLNKAFWDSVKAAIGGNRGHGWGQSDSEEVIDTLIAEFVPEINENKGCPPELLAAIGAVINPSAFRQKLETKDVNLLDENKTVRAKKNAALYAGLHQ